MQPGLRFEHVHQIEARRETLGDFRRGIRRPVVYDQHFELIARQCLTRQRFKADSEPVSAIARRDDYRSAQHACSCTDSTYRADAAAFNENSNTLYRSLDSANA